MKGYLTSYSHLFDKQDEPIPSVTAIQIPLIQRDYAQGRPSAKVSEIRTSFLEVLLGAVAGGDPVGLDFVYGKVDEQGTLHPLDGQQRLTTLFLLHWYLASAAGKLDPTAPWTRFSYATRVSAARFCAELVRRPLPLPLPPELPTPSAWVTDQPWYLHTWRTDPSITSFLVMIDAIHADITRLHPALDPAAAWSLLTREIDPAVSFYLLPIDDMESEEELYIKMNSRGKPLTEFENLKATFEANIRHSGRAEDFAQRIDGTWTDLFWPYRGADNLVDDRLVRYLDFVTELCEAREGLVGSGRLGPRMRAVFGAANDDPGRDRADDHLAFLFEAFDCWGIADVGAILDHWFTTALAPHDAYVSDKVVLFGRGTGDDDDATSTDLFEQCLLSFDSQAGRSRTFTLQQGLLLYAVLLHQIHGTDDFGHRLRMLRNLVAASVDEVRRDALPVLVRDVEALVLRGDLDGVKGLSTNQVDDERRKRAFLARNPGASDALFRLEDHALLRGTLSAFDLETADGPTFARRAAAFETAFTDRSLWPDLTSAMLATGDYQRHRPPKSYAWQFGTSSANNPRVWRYVLTDGDAETLAPVRDVLGRLLDRLTAAGEDISAHLRAITSDWLAKRAEAQHYDWRYLLVRYPDMREGATGIYHGVLDQLGYSMAMLRTQILSGWYRDPVLLAAWRLSGVGDRIDDPWFRGYADEPRWLRLRDSQVGIRSVSSGYALRPPEHAGNAAAFGEVCDARTDVEVTDDGYLLVIPQFERDGSFIDAVDRVEVGADLIQQLVARGL